MSVHSSLNGTANHFEHIAQVLLAQKKAGDTSSCDLQMRLKNGELESLHSMIAIANSEYLGKFLKTQRAPFQPIEMSEFEVESVKRVVEWMYTGRIATPQISIGLDLAVAEHLRMPALQSQLGGSVRKIDGSLVNALNIATERSLTKKGESALRPWLSVSHGVESGVQDLVLRLSTSSLSPSEVGSLTLSSVVALMAAPLPLKNKISLVNWAIDWILKTKPSRSAVNAIIQSLVITDITFDTLYSIRYSLGQYLTYPRHAGKTQLVISPSGSIGIHIEIKTNTLPAPALSSSSKSVLQNRKTRGSNPSPAHPPPVFRTKSELSDIQRMPDPFQRKSPEVEMERALHRDTTDGFPKFFTVSEVESLQKMTDPFQKSEKEEMAPRHSESTINYIRSLPDPFLAMNNGKRCQSAPRHSESTINYIRTLPDPFLVMNNGNGKRCQSAPRHSESTINYIRTLPDPFLPHQHGPVLMSPVSISHFSRNAPLMTSASNESLKSTGAHQKMLGVRKTQSEIDEINALPSLEHSSSSTSLSKSNSEEHKFKKSHYLFAR